MKFDKTAAFGIAVIFLFYLFLSVYRFVNMFELDAEQILLDTHAKFEQEAFLTWPRERALDIDSLMVYLIENEKSIIETHIRPIIHTNSSGDTVKVELVKYNCHHYGINRDSTNHQIQLKVDHKTFEKIPFTAREFSRITVCTESELSDARATIRLFIEPDLNPNYSVSHSLISCCRKSSVSRIKTIDGVLRKSKYLSPNVTYVIEVRPFNGF